MQNMKLNCIPRINFGRRVSDRFFIDYNVRT